MTANVIVCGAAGRMGRLLLGLIHDHPGLRLLGAVEAAGHPAVGSDAGTVAGLGPLGVSLVDDYAAVARPDTVALDFTVADAALAHLRTAAATGAAIAIGTTGLSTEQRTEAEQLAPRTRTIIAPNMSVGVNVLLKLVSDAARLLQDGFDAELIELHHRYKIDAPSGTALALGRAIAGAQGQDFDHQGRFSRHGLTGQRGDEEIGVQTLRGGDAVGDHTVLFVGFGERLELTHRAQSRECLARGALRAAAWLPDQAPGLYTMKDVLGL